LIQIPKQLQDERFRFIKTKPFNKKIWKHCTAQLKRDDLPEKERIELYQKLIRPKTPMEKEYKTTNNYMFNDPEFIKYLKIASGYAVLTGIGNLVVVESDTKELSSFVEENFPETFTVCSREYRKHFYFLISDITHAIPLGEDKDGNHFGEIQAGKTLITGANSIHAITAEKYKIIVDKPIAKIDKKDFFDTFQPYIKTIFDEAEYTEDYYDAFPEYNINISDVIDLSEFKQQSENRWQGIHPIHGSGGGRNFAVYPDRNYWRCFRCGTYGGVFSLIAVKHNLIECSDVKKGCLKGKLWEKTLTIARDAYGLEVSGITSHNDSKENENSQASILEKIPTGSQSYILYDTDKGDIAKITKQRNTDKCEYVFKGKFLPLRKLVLDGNIYYEINFGDDYIGHVTEIINVMKQRGGVINQRELSDAVNAVLSHLSLDTVIGHCTYGIYRNDDQLNYCTNPFPKSDEQKLICNEMKKIFSCQITKESLQQYLEMLNFWDSYEILPAMSWGIMASYAFVLREKGIMFQSIWNDSLESDLGKTTVGTIFSSKLWGIPDASGDSLASAFRVSDTLNSVGGLRVINEAEKIPWKSSVGQILKHSAERSIANKRGTSSGGSDYYYSRAGFLITSNGFPISSGNDLIRFFKIEFNIDKKKQRQQNRKVSQQLTKQLRQLQPIGYGIIQHHLSDINFSLKELISRCNHYGDLIVDKVAMPIKSDRRVTGYGIMYEGLRCWERVFQKYGIEWQAPTITDFCKDIVEKIETFTFESKIPPITEFLYWLENYKDSPSGEMKHNNTWAEKTITISEKEVLGLLICHPVITEYKRQTKDHVLNNLADIARCVSSISGYPVTEIYHPRKFKINEKTKNAVFIPNEIFEDVIENEKNPNDIDLNKYKMTIAYIEETIGNSHLSEKELQQRLQLSGNDFKLRLHIIKLAIADEKFNTTLAIDENKKYYNNTKINVEENKNSITWGYTKKRCNVVTKGLPTGEKNGYNSPPSKKANCNAIQRKKKNSGYKVTTNFDTPPHNEKKKLNYNCVQSIDELNKILKTISDNDIKKIAVDTETTSTDVFQADLVGISFSYQPNEAYYIPIAHKKQIDKINLPKQETLELLKTKILENTAIEKIGQNIKYDYHIFKNEGITLNPIGFDTMLASYVLNPNNRKSLDDLAKRYCNYTMQPIKELLGKGKKAITFDKVPIDKATFYACEDADYTYKIFEKLQAELNADENKKVKQIFYDLELPLISVIAAMERNGIAINSDEIQNETKKVIDELATLEQQIYAEAGEQFNINSSRTMQRILFDKLQYQTVKQTPNGQASTDIDVLKELSKKHTLPKLLLKHRELHKLYTTYLSAYPRLLNKKTGLIHTSFNQAGAVSGRFSSNNPNLQNIPLSLRKTFVPKDNDHVFLAADYSQMELCIIADFSQDENLINAFKSGKDIHTLTASNIYNISYSNVTKKQRDVAKTVNFGIIYGMSAYGLAARVDISIDEAQEFIDSYFKYYPDVKRYLTKIQGYAVKHGYVFTKFNRKIHLKKVFSKDRKIKKEGLRQAQNIPIQGTGADIIKLVMLQMHERLQSFDAQLILTIHDEIVFEVHKKDVQQVKKIIFETMENVVELLVPLKIEIGQGSNWYEAKGGK
jgi:DNA polymerase I